MKYNMYVSEKKSSFRLIDADNEKLEELLDEDDAFIREIEADSDEEAEQKFKALIELLEMMVNEHIIQEGQQGED